MLISFRDYAYSFISILEVLSIGRWNFSGMDNFSFALSWAILNVNFIVKSRINEVRSALGICSNDRINFSYQRWKRWNRRIGKNSLLISILLDPKVNLASSSNERVKTLKYRIRKLKYWTQVTVSIRRSVSVQTHILLESFERQNFEHWNGRKHCFRVDGRIQQQQQQY